MFDFFTNKEANEKIGKWIHQTYAKKAGLNSDEFFIHIDLNLVDGGKNSIDYSIYAGPCIHMWIRYPPVPEAAFERFKLCLDHIFSNSNLLELRRSKSLVRRSDAIKWYSLEASFIGKPPIRPSKRSVLPFTSRILTSVQVNDRKTGRTVIVTAVDSDAFTAQNEALRKLYGSRYD
jgi:hypothetical protein